jgi:hypothetical protein
VLLSLDFKAACSFEFSHSTESQVRFVPGQTVGVPCQIQGGAFTSEYFISIQTEEGILSGFADSADVRPDQQNPTRGTVRATVVDLEPDKIKVRIYGSFFTIAAGTIHFSSNWASTHLQVSA